MNKIYYVVIKGKTLESRNLKELLARAVSAKRDSDRRFQFQTRLYKEGAIVNTSRAFATSGQEIRV
jgi:hypothetical protein